jgi:superoxide dismutase, Fe-Mn family
MKKRTFLKTAGILATGALVQPLLGCASKIMATPGATPSTNSNKTFALPALGYGYGALEPTIDALTMEIHHSKHHQSYVDKLNAALQNGNDQGDVADLESICARVEAGETALRNNGGGHYNHLQFWRWLAPGGTNGCSQELEAAFVHDFGSFEQFKKAFIDAGKNRFGSGWVWLNIDATGKLFVSSTANQDNPLMAKIVERPGQPIVGIDVWEHAYYLHYQNKRADYLTAVFDILNWQVISADYKNHLAIILGKK